MAIGSFPIGSVPIAGRVGDAVDSVVSGVRFYFSRQRTFYFSRTGTFYLRR